MNYRHIVCEDRDQRQDFKKFKSLITTPANLVTGFKLPANGQIHISTTSVLAASTVLVTATGETVRQLGARSGPAGQTQHVGKLSRATNVVKAGGAPGTVKVYVANGFGHLYLIAQG
jgi:hypothetical protein